MEPFSHSGNQVQFWSITGKVVSPTVRSETHINTSYGTATTSGGVRYSVPRVSSNVVVKQQFFLLTDDGREVPIQLTGHDVPIRDGNTVTMIGGEVPPKGGDWLRIVVHDTGQWWNLEHDQLPHKWGMISGLKRVLILLGLIILGPILFFSGFSAGSYVQTTSPYGYSYKSLDLARGFVTGFAYGIVPWLLALIYFIRTVRSTKDLNRRLSSHLDMLSRNVLAAKPRVIA